MAKRWYVARLLGFEHQVAKVMALKDRIARFGMQEKFGDVLVPTEEVIEMRGGQKRRSERKFFPMATCWCRSRPTPRARHRRSTTSPGIW